MIKTIITLERKCGVELYRQLIKEFESLGVYNKEENAIVYDENDLELVGKIKEVFSRYAPVWFKGK